MQSKSKEEIDQAYIEDMVEGRIYTVEDVAERLHKSIWSVRSYIRDGLLAATKQGRHYVIPHSALRQYIVQNVVAPPSEDLVNEAAKKAVKKTQKKRAEKERLENGMPSRVEPVRGKPEPQPVEEIEEEAEEVEEKPSRPSRPTSFASGDF